MPEYYTDDNGNRVIIRHKGPPGRGLPPGGTTGQIYVKASNSDYDGAWANAPDGTDAAVGPASSVDGNFVLFDGTTGKLLKDSGRALSYYAPLSVVNNKVDKVADKGLSENDFTDADKAKLDALSEGGFRGVYADVETGEADVTAPNAGDYFYVEEADATMTLVLWDSTNEAWTPQTLELTFSGSDLATLLFNTDDAALYAQEDCRIYTSTDKATLATLNSLVNSALGGVGATSTSYVEKTASYNITLNDRTINCTSGSFTLTLPTAVGSQGRTFVIKNSGAGNITVATTGGQTIDGDSTAVLTTQWESITVQSTGSNWILV